MKRLLLLGLTAATVSLAGVGAVAAHDGAADSGLRGSAPRTLANVEKGLWEITQPGVRTPAQKVCLTDISKIAQVAHRGRQCTRMKVSESGDTTLMKYTCVAGGFGSAEIQVVTPRSLTVKAQGISNKLPFNRTYHARRVGRC